MNVINQIFEVNVRLFLFESRTTLGEKEEEEQEQEEEEEEEEEE